MDTAICRMIASAALWYCCRLYCGGLKSYLWSWWQACGAESWWVSRCVYNHGAAECSVVLYEVEDFLGVHTEERRHADGRMIWLIAALPTEGVDDWFWRLYEMLVRRRNKGCRSAGTDWVIILSIVNNSLSQGHNNHEDRLVCHMIKLFFVDYYLLLIGKTAPQRLILGLS